MLLLIPCINELVVTNTIDVVTFEFYIFYKMYNLKFVKNYLVWRNHLTDFRLLLGPPGGQNRTTGSPSYQPKFIRTKKIRKILEFTIDSEITQLIRD